MVGKVLACLLYGASIVILGPIPILLMFNHPDRDTSDMAGALACWAFAGALPFLLGVLAWGQKARLIGIGGALIAMACYAAVACGGMWMVKLDPSMREAMDPDARQFFNEVTLDWVPMLLVAAIGLAGIIALWIGIAQLHTGHASTTMRESQDWQHRDE